MKPLYLIISLALLLSNCLKADQESEKELYSDFMQVYRPEKYNQLFLKLYTMKASVYHTEGKGIGYDKGYTSLELFTMPSNFACKEVYPFLDLRGHGFNNLKMAGNIGLGLRIETPQNWILGVNSYYDYRQGSHKGFGQVGKGFQQIGIGVEALSRFVDFRLNLYQPLCKRAWHFSQTIFDTSTPIPTPIFIKKRQSIMQGGDFEAGMKIGAGFICNPRWRWESYLAGGSYYLYSKHHTINWGGKLRLSLSLAKFYLFEVRTSYDRISRGIVQVRLGVSLPLYPFSSLGQDCESGSCLSAMKRLITQPVERMEIIPLSRSKKIN